MNLKNLIEVLHKKNSNLFIILLEFIIISMILLEIFFNTSFNIFLIISALLMTFIILTNITEFNFLKKESSKKNDKQLPSKPKNPEDINVQKFEKIKDMKTQSDDNDDLGIPDIPEPPKRKDKISLDSKNISIDVLRKIEQNKDKDKEMILVNCERCKKVIAVPVPKDLVYSNKLPVVPISYVHNNEEGTDQHVITIYIDHDFDVRRQRLSDVVF